MTRFRRDRSHNEAAVNDAIAEAKANLDTIQRLTSKAFQDAAAADKEVAALNAAIRRTEPKNA